MPHLEKTKSHGSNTGHPKMRLGTQYVSQIAKTVLVGPLARFNEPRYHRWGLIGIVSFVVAYLIAPNPLPYYTLVVGERASETIFSPITRQIEDSEATQKAREEIEASAKLVYDFDDEMVWDIQMRVTNAFAFLRELLAAESRSQSGTEPRVSEVQRGSADAEPLTESRPDSSKLLSDEAARIKFERILGTSVSPHTFAIAKSLAWDPGIERDICALLVHPLTKGVVLNREHFEKDFRRGIVLSLKSKKGEELEPLKDKQAFYDLSEAMKYITPDEEALAKASDRDRLIRRLAKDILAVNVTFNRDKTEATKQEALKRVKPEYFQVTKGEPIIKAGETVREVHVRKLDALIKTIPPYKRYTILAGFTFLIALLLRLCSFFSERYLRRVGFHTDDLVLTCILLLGTVITVKIIVALGPLVAHPDRGMTERSILLLAPVAAGAMLMALLIDARMAFVFSVCNAIVASLCVEGDVYLCAIYFISGFVGLHGMRGVTDRTSLLRAGLVVGVVTMLVVFAVKLALGQTERLPELYEVSLGFLGGILAGLMVTVLSPLLEPLGYTTNVRLLELANLNHPLLKEMALKAPGTYHHSITVGNLAEAAAEAIGANPLLARVGAYYHDVGKIGPHPKPSYFVENQRRGQNPHDRFEPSMSALILLSHVKYGVEKAKEHRLSTPIIDIISQHHGTSLIKFFYHKALEKAERTHQSVSEETYHYPGPRPQTQEAAIVMLADVVEAASRTFTDPDTATLHRRVDDLLKGVFNEGQLDESPLTLRDLSKIRQAFVGILQGILHARIDYPTDVPVQEKNNGDLIRLASDKTEHQSRSSVEENGTHFRKAGP